MSKVFLDTNVLAYLFDGSEPVKQDLARVRLDAGGHDFVISTQVLLELYVVLTRKLSPPLSAVDAETVIDDLSQFPVVTTDAQLVRRALSTARVHQVSSWDGLILEAAAEAGCELLWTEDLSDGAVLRGVQIVNPFAA